MSTDHIWSKSSGTPPPAKPTVYREEKRGPPHRELICGKLQDEGPQPDGEHYKVVANGYVWVYLTDCNGTVDSAFQYSCIAGSTLVISGCHAFGCI